MGGSVSKNIRVCPLHSGDFEDTTLLSPRLEPIERFEEPKSMNDSSEKRLGDVQKVVSTSNENREESSECEVDQEEEEVRVVEGSFGKLGFATRTAASLTPENALPSTISALSASRAGKYTSNNVPFQKKSVRPSQSKTLCQKYPYIYGKSCEDLLPLISPQCRSKRANNLIPPRIPDSRSSLKMSTNWRTNRFPGGTYIHYPNRTVASYPICESLTRKNSITNRLKPIDKSLMPASSAAGDHILTFSRSPKPNTCILPPLLRSEFDKCKSTNGKKRNGDGKGLKVPEKTYFSSPRVKNTDLELADVLHNDQIMIRKLNGDTEGCMDQFFDNKSDPSVKYVRTFRLPSHQ